MSLSPLSLLRRFVGLNLTLGSGRADDDFRLLLERALAEPEAVRLRTTTMVLRLAPQGTAGGFPEVDRAVLTVSSRRNKHARGVSLLLTGMPLSLANRNTAWEKCCSRQNWSKLFSALRMLLYSATVFL